MPLDPKTMQAIAAIDQALAERQRLAGFSQQLPGRIQAARLEAETTKAAADSAAADALLGGELKPGTAKRGPDLRQAADGAAAKLRELEGAQTALPARLAAADARLIELDGEHGATVQAAIDAAIGAQMDVIAAAVRSMAPAILRLQAMAATGVGGIRRQLDESNFKLTFRNRAVQIGDGVLAFDGHSVLIGEAWTKDAQARALNADMRELVRNQPALVRVRSDVQRRGEAERIEEANRLRTAYRPQHTGPLRDSASEPAPSVPARTFVPNSYTLRQPG